MDKILAFMQSDNFMKLVYLATGLVLLFVGLINKQEVLRLIEHVISVCS